MSGDGILFAVIAWAALVYVAVSLAQLGLWLRRRYVSEADCLEGTVECPRCSEVALWESGPRSWECSECGHYETR